jgi:ankyrin repeat protein
VPVPKTKLPERPKPPPPHSSSPNTNFSVPFFSVSLLDQKAIHHRTDPTLRLPHQTIVEPPFLHMFRKGKSKVRISSVAYNAWGDPDKQKKAEKKIKKAIYDGANPNDTDSKYFTAMHWAAEYNWPKVVHIVMVTERFSGIKTNLNARQGLGGRTALIMAVARGHAEVTEMLLKFGADIEVVHEGQTAVDIAIDNGDEAIYELLCAHHPELALGANDSEEEEEDVDYEDALKELQTFTCRKKQEEDWCEKIRSTITTSSVHTHTQ